jgi:hypothetical protein
MREKAGARRKKPLPSEVLRFHDLDQAKSTILCSLPSKESQRGKKGF